MSELSHGAKEITSDLGQFPMTESLVLLGALLESGALHEAGGRIGVTADRASHVLRKFHDRFGQQAGLVAKKNNRYGAGAELQRHEPEFAAYFRAYDDLMSRMADLLSGRMGSIRVGTYNPALKLFLADAIGGYTSEQTQFPIQLPSDMTNRRVDGVDYITELNDDRLDFVVVPIGDEDMPQVDRRVVTIETLYRWNVVAIAHPQHPLMQRGAATTISPADLKSEPLLLAPEGFTSRRQVDSGFVNEGVDKRCVHENPDTETRVRLALAGYGVALAPNDTIPDLGTRHPAGWPQFAAATKKTKVNREKVTGKYVLVSKKAPSDAARNLADLDHFIESKQLFVDHVRRAAAAFREQRQLASE